jgi:selenocysteine lyase/cysteine desulfurase
MDWSRIRALFPAAERYTYLNTAASPPLSLLAAREGKRYYDEMAEHAEVAWDRWIGQVEEVREKLAEFVHAERRSIAFTYSSSHGMNLIAGILQHCGDVLCPADEFPSCTLPWLQQGYRVHFVRSRAGVLSISRMFNGASQRKHGYLSPAMCNSRPDSDKTWSQWVVSVVNGN